MWSMQQWSGLRRPMKGFVGWMHLGFVCVCFSLKKSLLEIILNLNLDSGGHVRGRLGALELNRSEFRSHGLHLLPCDSVT